jgi:ABC-type Mn2+/Zn2+ transport system permease subunit
MTKNTKMLIIISIYATAALFLGLWTMYNIELISGLVIFITHFALLGFALQGIENNIKTK